MQRLLMASTLIAIVSCSNDDNATTNPATTLPDDLPRVENVTFSNSTSITNPFYGPSAGQTYVYEGGEVGEEPEEEIRIERRTTTKVIQGIECIIHHDLVYKDNILIEDTDDWLAQDDDGNVWYFGEFVKNYEDDGTFSDNDGSWEYGIDDALPGYWMPANHVVGERYYQEWLVDEAEDYAIIEQINTTITIDLGTYTGGLVTRDINPFENNVYELKYYAPNVGFIKEEKYENGELIEVVELTEIIE